MIRRKKQPPNSSTCGHYCLSMLCKKPVKEIISIIGHQKATYVTDIRKVLKKLGYKSSKSLKRVYNIEKLPEVAILRLKWKGLINGHWMLWYKGKLYDPSSDIRYIESLHIHGATITSYLKIYNR